MAMKNLRCCDSPECFERIGINTYVFNLYSVVLKCKHNNNAIIIIIVMKVLVTSLIYKYNTSCSQSSAVA